MFLLPTFAGAKSSYYLKMAKHTRKTLFRSPLKEAIDSKVHQRNANFDQLSQTQYLTL